ncbi:DUF1801 domain-containing protein [Bacillaceae bacterium SIJ1]|uniref:DUF1801 domain-containing protein n=1 Tax=Litoribacterium kuwaitense TaxID=1398745 RepID=UPI0013EBD6B4|nr:DUF1801 domain-containing protein [Litoribacterium kuwaitense]NGP45658.1 DUF1801 domain-containing protein [Litoribacterium kuwaitense]
MYEQKTKPTDQDVNEFIESLSLSERKRAQSYQLLQLFAETSGYPPVMWGPSIIGFGKYQYTYPTGHSGESMLVGFSPRKQHFSLYFATGDDKRQTLLDRLGKHRAGKACVYVTNTDNIDQDVLKALITQSIAFLREHHKVV